MGGLERGELIAVYVGPAVAEELKRIVRESEITKCAAEGRASARERMLTDREDDSAWPKKNVVGRQELEVRLDKEHISFEVGTSKWRWQCCQAGNRRKGCCAHRTALAASSGPGKSSCLAHAIWKVARADRRSSEIYSLMSELSSWWLFWTRAPLSSTPF